MPEWASATPWWVVVGILVAIAGAVFGAGKWVGAVNTDRKSFNAFMDEIRNDIKRILERLPPPKAVRGSSPVRLTELGEKISGDLSVKAWATKEAPHLLDEAQGKPEFEIFELCVQHVGKRVAEDPDFQRTLRAGANEHGTEVEQIRKVHEVELRDPILRRSNA